MNVYCRIRFAVRSFFRSRDGSSPERPRRDGSYGWPALAATSSEPEPGEPK